MVRSDAARTISLRRAGRATPAWRHRSGRSPGNWHEPSAKIFFAPAAPTARSCQPGIKPTPRDTERLAQPTRRPDPAVLRNKTELHVDSLAKIMLVEKWLSISSPSYPDGFITVAP